MRNVPLLQSNSLVHAAKAMSTAPVFTLKPGEDGLCRAYEAEVPVRLCGRPVTRGVAHASMMEGAFPQQSSIWPSDEGQQSPVRPLALQAG